MIFSLISYQRFLRVLCLSKDTQNELCIYYIPTTNIIKNKKTSSCNYRSGLFKSYSFEKYKSTPAYLEQLQYFYCCAKAVDIFGVAIIVGLRLQRFIKVTQLMQTAPIGVIVSTRQTKKKADDELNKISDPFVL